MEAALITCPWCKTSYIAFQPNCSNCGGPLPAEQDRSTDELAWPPPAPRPFADSYAWRLAFSHAGTIAGIVLLMIGGTFIFLSVFLLLAVVTAIVGIPFFLLGMVSFIVGAILLRNGYNQALGTVNVLRFGEAVRGRVSDVQRNLMVEVNNRNPWVIRYQFQLNGASYTGQVTTLQDPEEHLQPGAAVCVLYLPAAPQENTIYPHP
jgi:hypothetical protein